MMSVLSLVSARLASSELVNLKQFLDGDLCKIFFDFHFFCGFQS